MVSAVLLCCHAISHALAVAPRDLFLCGKSSLLAMANPCDSEIIGGKATSDIVQLRRGAQLMVITCNFGVSPEMWKLLLVSTAIRGVLGISENMAAARAKSKFWEIGASCAQYAGFYLFILAICFWWGPGKFNPRDPYMTSIRMSYCLPECVHSLFLRIMAEFGWPWTYRFHLFFNSLVYLSRGLHPLGWW